MKPGFTMRMKPRGGTCAHRQAVWLLANSRSASEDSSVAACARAVKTRQNTSKHVRTRQNPPSSQNSSNRPTAARPLCARGPGGRAGPWRLQRGPWCKTRPCTCAAGRESGQRWSKVVKRRSYEGTRERYFRARHAVDETARIHAVASAPPSHSPPKRRENSQKLGGA